MEIVKRKKKTSEKVKKQITKGNLGQKLLMMNDYLKSLLDPFGVRKVKIPDDVTTHSCAYSVTQRFAINTDASGFCGIALGQVNVNVGNAGVGPFTFSGSMIPCQWVDAAPVTSYAIGYQLGSAAGVIFGDTTRPIILSQWSTTNNSIPNTFANNRLVSAGARLTYIGTVLNAQGLITAWSNPRETYGNNNVVASGGLSVGFLQQLENSSVYSVPKEGGCMVAYLPQDPISQQYCPAKHTETYNSESSVKFYCGEMGFIVTGAVASQSFEVELCLNYEGEPYLNSFSLTQATPSKSDPIALAHAANVIADVKPIAGISKSMATKAVPVADAMELHAPNSNPTMLESVLGAVGSVSKAMPAVSQIAQTMGPLIGNVLGMI